MSHGDRATLHLGDRGRYRALQDVAIVTFLVVLLGAFVLEIARGPRAPAAAPAPRAPAEVLGAAPGPRGPA